MVGAAIGAKTQNLGLIIILGIVIHFIMDKVPHWDYPLPSVFGGFRKDKKIKQLLPDFVKMSIDIVVAFLIIFLILQNKKPLDPNYLSFVLSGIFASLFPDIFFGIVYLIPGKSMERLNYICNHYLHYRPKDKEKEGKITFLKLTTQILIIILSTIIFFS